MILSITAVYDKYVNLCLENINKYDNGKWDIHIQTNQPEKFNKWTVHEYDKNTFYMFDKILFSLKLSQKYKEPVILLDADDLHKPSNKFINEFEYDGDKILYPGYWLFTDGTYQSVLDNPDFYPVSKPRFKYMVEYWERLGVDYKNLTTIDEWLLYLPYFGEKTTEIIHDIEYYKCLLETGTIMCGSYFKGVKHYKQTVLGAGEGVLFSYVFNKHNIEYETFKPDYIL